MKLGMEMDKEEMNLFCKVTLKVKVNVQGHKL
jgi:hypothetical protein